MMAPTTRSSQSSGTSRAQHPLKKDARVSKKKPIRSKSRTIDTKTEHVDRARPSVHRPRVPDLPADIISNILRFSHVRENGHTINIHPRRSFIKEHETRHNISGPRIRCRNAFERGRLELLPMKKDDMPAANLLLVNKLFRDEGLKQFYGNNVFSFIDDHDFSGTITSISQSKKDHVHHVAFEAQWSLKVDLKQDFSGEIEHEFAAEWGRCIMYELGELPNIKTITLRIHCVARYQNLLERYIGFTWDMLTERVWIKSKDQLLGYPEVKDGMKAAIAEDIEAKYSALETTKNYLPMIRIIFLYHKNSEWQEEERVLLLTDIERDPARFGIPR